MIDFSVVFHIIIYVSSIYVSNISHINFNKITSYMFDKKNKNSCKGIYSPARSLLLDASRFQY